MEDELCVVPDIGEQQLLAGAFRSPVALLPCRVSLQACCQCVKIAASRPPVRQQLMVTSVRSCLAVHSPSH